jgi:hypothetical protein
MGPRIYPSQQDTNLTAKGSLILTTSTANSIEIYVNSTIVNKQFSIINGLYSYGINIGDVVTITSIVNKSFNVTRKDYTTDDNNGNSGIVDTFITGVTNVSSFTFTATTSPSSYNFEYLISMTPTPTPTPTPLPTKNMDLKFRFDSDIIPYLGASATFNQKNTNLTVIVDPYNQYFSLPLSPNQIIFSGDTTGSTLNLGNLIISTVDSTTNLTVGYGFCYSGLSSNSWIRWKEAIYDVYVDNVLVDNSIIDMSGFINRMELCGTDTYVYGNITGNFNNLFGDEMLVVQKQVIEIYGPTTAQFAPEASGKTYACYSASTYTFAANSNVLSDMNDIKGSIITSLAPNGYFYLSKDGQVRKYQRRGTTDEAVASNPVELCVPPSPPANVTVQYRYVGTGGSTSVSKNVSNLIGQFYDGTTLYNATFTSLSWSGSTDTTQTQSLTLPYTGSYEIIIRRRICRSNIIGQTIDNRYIKFFINGTEVLSTTLTGNITIPVCPTNSSSTINLGTATISDGDILQFYYEDDL